MARMPHPRAAEGQGPLCRVATSLGIVVLCTTALAARALQTPIVSLSSVDTIRSKVLSETRIIRIALPVSYNTVAYATERYPLLIVLDAQNDLALAATIANARALAVAQAPVIPELIVVGVDTMRNRYRDTTLPPLDGTAQPENDAGGAPRFSEFLTAELMPYLSIRYRTLNFVVVVGHSMTGSLATYLYGHSPTKIHAAVALSPSLLWDFRGSRRPLLEGVRDRTTPGRFFIAASRGEDPEIADKARELVRELPSAESPTASQFRELGADSHANTWVQGVIDGLRFVFHPMSLAGTPMEAAYADPAQPSDAARVADAYAAVRQKYLAGAKSLGFPERMPFRFGYAVSQFALIDDDNPNLAAAALPICEDIVRTYPSLWHGHECLGRASLVMGDRQAASHAFQEALRLAKRAQDVEGAGLAQEGLRAVARRRGAR